ncbi:proto-oncogene Mas-like [Sceloporus undulatus]|uniref:proto-oncogene Mas-like n=1 Tax=Sceloporus undulatus TaxID=8520 RepID=UPI001C4C48F3|nr:proto-oncogene Mas-like [Sceloporus undulatus]
MNIQEVVQKQSLSLMMNYSVNYLPPLNHEKEYEIHLLYEYTSLCSSSECKVIRSFTFLISTFGLVGNGIVIWLLGFHIKRNPFTTFILNLAVADFGVLIYMVIECIVYMMLLFSNRHAVSGFYSWLAELLSVSIFLFLHFTGQFLLTAISIDRCVSVLFPIWHKCHRPTYLSTTVCAILWVTSFLFCLTPYIAILTNIYGLIYIKFAVPPLLCLPLMVISSLILFIKVCFKSPKHKRGKALTAISLTLLFFFIFVIPVIACLFISSFIIRHLKYHSITQYSFLGASLNSSVNPFIYFLVGRQKRGQRRERLKNILQRLFKEEEEEEEEGNGADMDSPV